ncbi:MAG: flagellar basal body-associated FliL family protein [Peptococcales bacterium]|jgi:flagellar basal body-associated protein FliL
MKALESQNVSLATKKFNFKYIIIAIVFLLVSFASSFLVSKSYFNPSFSSEQAKLQIGPLYNTPEFTVNIANSNGRRFLMTQFSLEVDSKKVLKELEKKLPLIQDQIILILSAQTLEDLGSLDGKNKIKQSLIDNLNNLLSDGQIVNIFFNKFVYQ